MAAEVFEFNQKQLGYNFSLLDIGGGFPGTRDSGELFEKMAATITSSLSRHFSAYPGVRIIAEPGNDCISFAYTNTLNCKCYLACTEVYTPYPPLYYSKYAGMLLCNVASFPYTHDNFLFFYGSIKQRNLTFSTTMTISIFETSVSLLQNYSRCIILCI